MGWTFDAGRRTAAHIFSTYGQFKKRFPGLTLVIAQTCYHAGYEPSAGTHDKDGVLDFYVLKANGAPATEADYWAVQRWLRAQGWLVWFRHTGTWASRGSWHLHAVSNGCPGPMGIYVPGQITDAYNHTFGLANQHNVDLDKSWWPGDPSGPPPWPVGTPASWKRGLDKAKFDYPAWKDTYEMNTQEHKMLADTAQGVADLQQAVADLQAGQASAKDRDQRQDKRLREMLRSKFNATDAQIDEVLAEVKANA